MKQGIHPEYRDVIFHDISCDYYFINKSTIKAKETITWKDGKTYPLVKVEISSHSHPFFTGKQKFIDSAGRLEKFQKKFGWGQKKE